LNKAQHDVPQHPFGNLETGLSSEEARRRLEEIGPNDVPEHVPSRALSFVKKFWGIVPWVLELTALVEWLLGKYAEVAVIVALLVANAVISFTQQEKANSALALLKQELSVTNRVKRDSEWKSVPARELVPGDIIRLRAGDFVPADVRAFEGNVEVDQSAVTGESLPVARGPNELLLSGSVVRRGEVTGGVASTGTRTQFGRSVQLVKVAKPKLHVEEVITRVVRWLFVMVGIALALATAVALLQSVNLVDMLTLTAILLASTIPVALPTMLAISMALGSLELSRKGVLVTRLDAVEDAATVDVVCVDKTGTLTLNKLAITEVIPAAGYEATEVIRYGALASQEANQDPIDLAFTAAAKVERVSLRGYRQRSFVPFEPATKYTEATVDWKGQRFHVFKGAVPAIFRLCRDSPEYLKNVGRSVESLSARGFRVLAVAKGTTPASTRLVGVAALLDPPRSDSARFIAELKDVGVSVKMLTGDALPIAKEVAADLGLGSDISTVSELRGAGSKGASLPDADSKDGFAEITPEDKYIIVRSLQEDGHVVGMTGDGVNDAPALRQAEVGIAVSNATDVAKGAASAVLTVEGLGGILDLLEVGRRSYQRVVTWTLNKIIRTFVRVMFIVAAFLLIRLYVVSTLHMVLLLFLGDFVTLTISTDNVRYSQKPETWDIRGLVKVGVVYGAIIVPESLLLVFIGLTWLGLSTSLFQLQTFVFVWMTLTDYCTVLVVRERRHFWQSRPSRPLLVAILADVVIVLSISVFGIPMVAPIPLLFSLIVLVYALLTTLLLNDFIKVFLARRFNVTL
jgi:H+-transporting ATPase